MVDTPRTRAAIQTLFADNTSGAISPQDLRDFVVSVPFYELTSDETAAGVTPSDYRYPPGNVRRYGAVGDGVTDDITAFQNAVDSLSSTSSRGGIITVPYGQYYLSATWQIYKMCTIEGTNAADTSSAAGTELIFAQDIDGVRFYNAADTTSGIQESTQSIIKNINIYCGTKNLSGRGIYATTAIKIEDCIVRNFAGHGIEIYGDTTNGIADFWRIIGCRILNCGGDGLYIHGTDAQIGTAIGVECSSNGGWGIHNNTPYTNVFIGCQASGNTSGAYYDAYSMSYEGAVLIGCYAEAGATANCTLKASTVCIASPTVDLTQGATFGQFSPGIVGMGAPASGIVGGWIGGTEVWRVDSTGVFKGPSKFQADASGTNYYAAGAFQLYNAGTADTKVASFQNTNGEVGHINTSGTATTYNTSSDYRLKENVKPLQAALDVINKLNPVTFDWKSDGTSYTGFIAHELQEVIPIAVTGEKDGEEMQAVDQSKIVPFLVAAIKELSAKIDELTR